MLDRWGNTLAKGDAVAVVGELLEEPVSPEARVRVSGQHPPVALDVASAIKVAAIPPAQRWCSTFTIYGWSAGNVAVHVKQGELPTNIGAGCPMPLTHDCTLDAMQILVRHATAADPGPWTFTLSRYSAAGALLSETSFAVPMSALGFAFNLLAVSPGIDLVAGDSIGASFVGATAADYVVGQATMSFTRGLL